MTSDAELAEVAATFRRRWTAEIAELRRELAEHLDEVLAVQRREDPEHPGRGLMPPELADPDRPLPLAGVDRWPAGWPGPPLTVGAALDLMERDSETPADAAAYLTNCVRVFVAPDLQAEVLADPEVLDGWGWEAGWRWPGERGNRTDPETPLREWVEGAACALRPGDGDDGDGWDRLWASLRGPLPGWPFPFTAWDAVRWGRLRLEAARGEDARLYLDDEDTWLPHLAPDYRRHFRGPAGELLSFRVYDLGLLAWAEWRRRPAGLAWQTMGRLLATDPGAVHFRMAADVLAEDGAYADDDQARWELAGKLTAELRRAAEHLGMAGEAPEGGGAPPERDGRLALDAAAADFLARFGDEGGKVADALRAKAAERWRDFTGAQADLAGPPPLWRLWRLWLPPAEWVKTNRAHPPSPFALALCAVLWRDVVRPERERRRNRPPALQVDLLECLARGHTPGGRVEAGPDGPVLVDQAGEVVVPVRRAEPLPVPVADLDALDALTRRGAKALGSLDAHRLLRWMVCEGWERAMADARDARHLVVEGGWAELARIIGASDKGRKQLPAIVAAMAHLWWHLPDGSAGNLLSYRATPARGQRGGRVVLTLGDALLPGYAHGLPRGHTALVPVVDLPPLVGRARDHGAQATQQLYVLAELRKGARELVTDGGVLLLPERWDELADRSGLPEALRGRVLDRWTRDGDDDDRKAKRDTGPAFLARVDRNRYTLGEAHRDARDFLEDGGRIEVGAREGGRQGAARKRKKLRRKGRRSK